MNNRLIRRAFIVLPALLLALGGCVNEVETEKPTPGNPAPGKEAVFTVSVPGMKTPSTRALDATKEKEIAEVNVVIFSNADNTLLEHYRIDGSAVTAAPGGNDWQFKVRDIEHTTNITAALIANASIEVADALNAVKSGDTWVGAEKADFLLALQVGATTKWNTSAGGYWTIPMYGEAVVTGSIYGGALPAVNLTRMLAKVDIVNSVAPVDPLSPADGTFELTAVHVVNYNTAGVIAPKWNETTGAIDGAPATSANLPSGFNAGTRAWSDGNELTYTLASGQASILDEIYLFESDALSGNPVSPDGLRLVFEGNYTAGGITKSYYYPVDFTTPQGAYMPVLRNNRYQFTITEASGRGYDRMGEAVAAFGVMSNLRTSLVTVDESGIKHLVWNGEHFLGVSEKEFNIALEGGQNIELLLATNYAGGWKAEVEDAAANPWLTLTDGPVVSGSPGNGTLSFNVAAITDEWTFNNGAILLSAGRLQMRVPVIQGVSRLETDPTASFIMDGDTHSIEFSTNTRWVATFSGDMDVITTSTDPVSGGAGMSQTLDFGLAIVGTGGARTIYITFSSPDNLFAPQTVTVTANLATLSISPKSVSFTYAAHGAAARTTNFTISTNIPVANLGIGFAGEAVTKYTINAKVVTATVAVAIDRQTTGTVTVSAGDLSETFTVTRGKTPYTIINGVKIDPNNRGGTWAQANTACKAAGGTIATVAQYKKAYPTWALTKAAFSPYTDVQVSTENCSWSFITQTYWTNGTISGNASSLPYRCVYP